MVNKGTLFNSYWNQGSNQGPGYPGGTTTGGEPGPPGTPPPSSRKCACEEICKTTLTIILESAQNRPAGAENNSGVPRSHWGKLTSERNITLKVKVEKWVECVLPSEVDPERDEEKPECFGDMKSKRSMNYSGSNRMEFSFTNTITSVTETRKFLEKVNSCEDCKWMEDKGSNPSPAGSRNCDGSCPKKICEREKKISAANLKHGGSIDGDNTWWEVCTGFDSEGHQTCTTDSGSTTDGDGGALGGRHGSGAQCLAEALDMQDQNTNPRWDDGVGINWGSDIPREGESPPITLGKDLQEALESTGKGSCKKGSIKKCMCMMMKDIMGDCYTSGADHPDSENPEAFAPTPCCKCCDRTGAPGEGVGG